MRRSLLHAAALLAVLTVVAVVSPAPGESNRDFYQHSGRQLLMPHCSGGDCFRPLIPIALESLPGPSLVKWKAYAVIFNLIGAFAVGRFCLLLGLSSTAALAATWLSALGAGALYSVFDCYTSDPLMYALGPLMTIWLWRGRYVRAGAAGVAGIFAKEFAAAPIWIFAGLAALERRWNAALRLLLTAVAVTLVWLATHASFMVLEDYSYGATASADLLHGGFLATWLRSVRLGGALTYLFTSFGALYLVSPIGLVRSRELRRLAIAAVPALVAFVYVEQPERALWNFHFIVVPLAVVILGELPDWAIALFVTSFGIANLRFGAQLPIRGAGRMALLVSLAIAAVAVVLALTRKREAIVDNRPAPMDEPVSRPAAWSAAAVQAIVLVSLVIALFDVRGHRQGDGSAGANQWGYRGPLQAAPHAGVHIAIVGGTAAFDAGTPWPRTLAAQLASDVNARQRWTTPGGPYASVADLAEPGAGAASYVATLRDFASMHPDIVCVYDGYDAVGSPSALGRHRSIVFRLTGYLPRSPAVLLRGPDSIRDAEPAPDPIFSNRLEPVPDVSCAGTSASYCTAIRDTVRFGLERNAGVVVATPPYVSPAHEAQQQSLAEMLTREFGREPRFRYVNLGRAIDPGDRAMSRDATHPTPEGARTLATRLADSVLELIRARIQ